jgi:hypothetical protein
LNKFAPPNRSIEIVHLSAIKYKKNAEN